MARFFSFPAFSYTKVADEGLGVPVSMMYYPYILSSPEAPRRQKRTFGQLLPKSDLKKKSNESMQISKH